MKISEIKLILSIILFAVALAFDLYGVFSKNAHASNTSMAYILISLALGRTSVLVFRKARQTLKE